MGGRFRLVLAGACALCGVMACLAYAESVRSEAQRIRSDALERFGGEVTQLVVAEHPLEAGDVVTESSVSLRDWVSDLAPVGALTSLDEVIGREVSVPAAQGAPLTELNFRDAQALAEVPTGHVAVSVPVSDKLGIARGVSRGTRVSAYEVADQTPRLIATDVEVLSELGLQSGIGAVQQLTIAVKPDEVKAVLGASTNGTLRLVMPAADVAETVADEVPAAPEEASIDEKGSDE